MFYDRTMILHSFVTPSTLAVTMAVPFFLAVTSPWSLMTATLVFLDFQVTLRWEETLAVRRNVLPAERVILVLFSVTFGFFTVTLQVRFTPSADAVIVVLPGFNASILPFSSMTATLLFEDFHVRAEPLVALPLRR